MSLTILKLQQKHQEHSQSHKRAEHVLVHGKDDKVADFLQLNKTSGFSLSLIILNGPF